MVSMAPKNKQKRSGKVPARRMRPNTSAATQAARDYAASKRAGRAARAPRATGRSVQGRRPVARRDETPASKRPESESAEGCAEGRGRKKKGWLCCEDCESVPGCAANASLVLLAVFLLLVAGLGVGLAVEDAGDWVSAVCTVVYYTFSDPPCPNGSRPCYGSATWDVTFYDGDGRQRAAKIEESEFHGFTVAITRTGDTAECFYSRADADVPPRWEIDHIHGITTSLLVFSVLAGLVCCLLLCLKRSLRRSREPLEPPPHLPAASQLTPWAPVLGEDQRGATAASASAPAPSSASAPPKSILPEQSPLIDVHIGLEAAWQTEPAPPSYEELKPRGLAERVAQLESAVLGQAGEGPLIDRLTQLELGVAGKVNAGSIMDRVVALEKMLK